MSMLADAYKKALDYIHSAMQPIAAAPGSTGAFGGTKSNAKKEAEDELTKNDSPAGDTSTAASK